jgi:DNA-binding NarL/FixJ family response regulator
MVPLSTREQDVVRLIAEGRSNKEISSVLAISVRTVETYRARLMLKLGASSVAQLVHYAIRNHIITI